MDEHISWMNIGLSSIYKSTFIHLIVKWMDELLYTGLDDDVHSYKDPSSPSSLVFALGFEGHFLQEIVYKVPSYICEKGLRSV